MFDSSRPQFSTSGEWASSLSTCQRADQGGCWALAVDLGRGVGNPRGSERPGAPASLTRSGKRQKELAWVPPSAF